MKLDPRQDTPREIAARHVTQDGLNVTVLGVPLSYLNEADALRRNLQRLLEDPKVRRM